MVRYGETSKEIKGQILDLFKKRKDNEYCAHDIAGVFSIHKQSAYTNLSQLQHLGFIKVSSEKLCEGSKKEHKFYQYASGTKEDIMEKKPRGKKKPKKKRRGGWPKGKKRGPRKDKSYLIICGENYAEVSGWNELKSTLMSIYSEGKEKPVVYEIARKFKPKIKVKITC